MDTQSPLTQSSLPLWVESYPNGVINMKHQNISKFKPDVLKYKYSIESAKKILKQGDNSKTKMPRISSKQTTLKQTTPLSYESFAVNPYPEENFLLPTNMASHMDPIWVLIIFLLAIWIIYFIAK
jgi:hypothetical protein